MHLHSRLRSFSLIRRTTPFLNSALFALIVAGTASAPHADIPDNVTTRNFFGEDFTFDHPLIFKEVPGEDSVYLVVQQFGEIVLVRRDGNEWVKSRFDSVAVGVTNLGNNNDAGLLGYAFHPDYRENRKYYVYYVQDYAVSPSPGTILLAERTADSTLLRGSGDAERVVLRLKKPYSWHSGGTLNFGKDGYLYTAIGDGGNVGDPGNRAQNPGVLFGKMLRIDVDGPDAFDDTTRNYAVPEDNPFLDSAEYLPEIWALGLRSPWKWHFHPETGDIWLGDVGQGTREEVTTVPRGGNLGWKMWEGTHCFTAPCPEEGTVAPVLDLDRGSAISVTGGTFVGGSPEGAFHNLYVFGDYGTDSLWALREDEGDLVEYASVGEVASVVSIDGDSQGRVFAVSLQSGSLFDPRPWTGTGTVQILESPDIIPVSVTPQSPQRPAIPEISRAEVLKNRDRYIVRGLDGRKIPGRIPTGVFLVYERGASSPKLLFSGM